MASAQKLKSHLRTIAGVGVAVGACMAAGSVLSAPDSPWYKSIKKPSWQPPAIAFPIAWTALYSDIAVVSSLVLIRAHEQQNPHQAGSYRLALGTNLVLNATWSGLFFRSKKPVLSSVEALGLAVSSTDLVRRACKSSPALGVALAPYAAWTSFAFALNSSIAYLNRDYLRINTERKRR